MPFMSRKNRIIFSLSLIVFISCAVYLGVYSYNSRRAIKHFDELEQIVEAQKLDENGKEVDYETNSEGKLIRYLDLSERNADMVGWLSIENTELNYPVMQQADNNDFYLNHNFDKVKQSGGLPVLDYECDIQKPSDNVVIYGHNMRNGSVFATLTKYKKENFVKEHSTIVLDTLYEHREYQIMAVFNTKVGSDKEFRYHHFVETFSEEDFAQYVSRVKELSLYETGVGAKFGDNLLTLSTCSYGTSNERFVVVAKRIL